MWAVRNCRREKYIWNILTSLWHVGSKWSDSFNFPPIDFTHIRFWLDWITFNNIVCNCQHSSHAVVRDYGHRSQKSQNQRCRQWLRKIQDLTRFKNLMNKYFLSNWLYFFNYPCYWSDPGSLGQDVCLIGWKWSSLCGKMGWLKKPESSWVKTSVEIPRKDRFSPSASFPILVLRTVFLNRCTEDRRALHYTK